MLKNTEDAEMAVSSKFGSDVQKAVGDRTYRHIAAKMGVSPAVLSNMILGRIPTEPVLRKFADAIGQEPEVWLRRAKLYREEVHLRDLGSLTDAEIDTILGIMEEAEKR